jgi:uncharacterized membrane protein YqgA involved in biofilm formation|nr:MAG TPA: hemolysin [Caudoviricetes sp.]
MASEIIVAILACIGTVIGSMCGVIATNNKTLWRIEQLEKRVEKHNNIVERMIEAEDKLKSHQHQINELRERTGNND